MRIVSGGKWTADGRWVVLGHWLSQDYESIIFDPGNGDPWLDIQDCIQYTQENG